MHIFMFFEQLERGITSESTNFTTTFDLAAVHEEYYFQFDYLYKLSYLTSNNYS